MFLSVTGSSDNVGVDGEVNGVSQDKNVQHRANTTMHVCWHRSTSVSMRDHERAIKVTTQTRIHTSQKDNTHKHKHNAQYR